MSATLESIVSKLRDRDAVSPLSAREQEILHMISKGLISKQIAGRLGTSQHTVDNQRSTIMKKLGAITPAHMVWIACQRGLV